MIETYKERIASVLIQIVSEDTRLAAIVVLVLELLLEVLLVVVIVLAAVVIEVAQLLLAVEDKDLEERQQLLD